MKKLLIIGMCIALWIMCLTTAVFADIDLEQSIDTNGGDLDGSWWIDTNGGDSEVTINGVKPFGTYITNTYKESSGGSLNMDAVYRNLAKVFMKYNYLDKSYEPIPFNDKLNYYQKMFRYVLEQTFMTRQEYLYRESMMMNQIEQLNLRVMTLESFYNETELCNKGLVIAVQENVSKYSCDNTDYYNKFGEFIGVKIVTESEEKFLKEIEKNISITNISLSKYNKLCDTLPTNNKYCNVVGKFDKAEGGI